MGLDILIFSGPRSFINARYEKDDDLDKIKSQEIQVKERSERLEGQQHQGEVQRCFGHR